MLRVFKDDTAPSPTYAVTLNGAAQDIDGATAVFSMGLLDTSPKVDGEAASVDGASDSVTYAWQAGDTDTPGDYVSRFTLTLSGGAVQTTPAFVVVVQDPLSSTLDLERLRNAVETDLDDIPLLRLMNACSEDVSNRFGTDASRTVTLYGEHRRFLRLPRKASSITSIVEKNQNRDTLYTLTANDYALVDGGRILERLAGGIYASNAWAPIVEVTYTPVADTAIRSRVIQELVQAAVQYDATTDLTIGDYRKLSPDYLRERERIMLTLVRSRGFGVA